MLPCKLLNLFGKAHCRDGNSAGRKIHTEGIRQDTDGFCHSLVVVQRFAHSHIDDICDFLTKPGFCKFVNLLNLIYDLTMRKAAEVPHFSRSEEHTSELQSRGHLVCRLLLEKKNRVTRWTRCSS